MGRAVLVDNASALRSGVSLHPPARQLHFTQIEYAPAHHIRLVARDGPAAHRQLPQIPGDEPIPQSHSLIIDPAPDIGQVPGDAAALHPDLPGIVEDPSPIGGGIVLDPPAIHLHHPENVVDRSGIQAVQMAQLHPRMQIQPSIFEVEHVVQVGNARISPPVEHQGGGRIAAIGRAQRQRGVGPHHGDHVVGTIGAAPDCADRPVAHNRQNAVGNR